MKSTYESAKTLSKPYVHKSKQHELPIELNDRFEVLMSQYAKLKTDMLTTFGLQCEKQTFIDENGKPKTSMVWVDRTN